MKLPVHEQLRDRLEQHWKPHDTARIFITGGTGFFGKWLLHSFLWAKHEFGLKTSLTLLSRDPKRFLSQNPQFQDPSIRFIAGDVLSFSPPEEPFDLIIHGATDASDQLNREQPMVMIDTILTGTRKLLDFAIKSQAKRFLFLSSGAIYGTQSDPEQLCNEAQRTAPNLEDPRSAYGEAKRLAELLCTIYFHQQGLETVSARGYAFVGPYLPLDTHFAVGNFIGNALSGKPIEIKGDGKPLRSFLYGEDLGIWLWELLFCGQPGESYNLGSEEKISILELAQLVQSIAPQPIEIIGPAQPPGAQQHVYVPSIQKAQATLGLQVWTPLEKGIQKTIQWHLQQGSPIV